MCVSWRLNSLGVGLTLPGEAAIQLGCFIVFYIQELCMKMNQRDFLDS